MDLSIDYTVHVIEVKMWEWEAIKEKWNMEIAKHGPSEDICQLYDQAVSHARELAVVLDELKHGPMKNILIRRLSTLTPSPVK